MDLKQHLIHRSYTKCEAKNQITIGDDYSVPDGKPDVAKILQKRADISVEEVNTEKGKVRIRGFLKVDVFYLAQRSKQVVESLEMQFPFDETMYMDGAVSGDNLKIDWEIEDLRINIVHPGKLDVRSVAMLRGVIKGCENYLITEGVEAEGIHKREQNYQMAQLAMNKKDSYRIRDEVSLSASKPNVQKMLWHHLQMRELDIRIQENRLAIKGECHLFVVYEGEEEKETVQWFEQTIPFQGTLDAAGIHGEMFGTLESEISHQNVEVKPDYDGELRSFQIEMMLDIHMNLYEVRDCNVLQDAYSTSKQLKLQKQDILYEKLRMCNQAKGRISGQAQLEQKGTVLQIVSSLAKLSDKRYKLQEQGILCEGILEAQILYITSSDQEPFGSVNVEIPYSQLVDVPGIQPKDQWEITEIIDQIFITMRDGNSLEVKANLNFNVCVMEQCRLENITEIICEDYDMEEYKKRPGMVIHFVQPKETLWELAKAYWTTTEEIKKVNELSSEEVAVGQKILLMKNSMETL